MYGTAEMRLLRVAIKSLLIEQSIDEHITGGVVPAQAGIHKNTGFRIKSGMTEAAKHHNDVIPAKAGIHPLLDQACARKSSIRYDSVAMFNCRSNNNGTN